MSYTLINDLRSGRLPLPGFLAQVETHFREHEPSVQSFLPEENRFARLQEEGKNLLVRFPDLINRPVLFSALAGIKDIFHVEGFTTQAGSRLPAEILQGEEAESVKRLKDGGVLIFGKTITTEFAYFSPGPTRNPHNLDHTPGGSSSGSAAAVAAGFCHLALGTQTIGSIIRPASFCGVIGFKPTYDRISRQGVIPLSPSLDHVGFFTPDVETAIQTARILFPDWDEPLGPLKKPVLGIPDGPYLESVSAEGRTQFEKVAERLSKEYQLQHIPIMSDFQVIRDRHDVILSAEVAQVHRDWFEHHTDLYSNKFSELVRRGQQIPRDQYQNALSARDQFRADLQRTFLDHNLDLWISPATIGAAPKGLDSTGDPVMNLPWTQAGLPAINLPAGKNPDGLPMGLQVAGNWYKDEDLLFWAKDLERVLAVL